MKTAILHLDLAGGPQEKNIKKLCGAMRTAKKHGAVNVITPEMAVQGYFMARNDDLYEVNCLDNEYIETFQELANELEINIFLGCAHYDKESVSYYNSCMVIDKFGNIVGCHNKNKVVGGQAESWSTAGKVLEPICCDGHSYGVLVCADAWYDTNAYKLAAAGAEIIFVIAAWPPGCGGPPEIAWERCSTTSKLPVVVCNQTGTSNGMDCTIAKSAIAIDGELKAEYFGAEEAVLMFDTDKLAAMPIFTVLKWGE